MEPEGSLPHSQAPAICPYPEPASQPAILRTHNIISFFTFFGPCIVVYRM
jgi:hypothetical protein